MNAKLLPIALMCGFALTGLTLADDDADRATSIKQLRQLVKLSSDFASANQGRLPKTFDELLAFDKRAERSLLIAPYATDKEKPSYELLLPGKKISSITNPARTVAIRSVFTTADGSRLGAFVDGHIEVIRAGN